MVKNPPAMQETWVGKIPWRRAWQPTPVFLPGESPWTEEPGGLQSMGSQRVGRDRAIKHTAQHGHFHCVSGSVVSDSANPWTVAHQAPLSMEFSRQEYWSGLSFSSPGNLPDPGIEPGSPAL